MLNIVSGNSLLPDVTKPSPETMWIYLQWCPVKITRGHFKTDSSVTNINFKISYLKSHSNLQWANESATLQEIYRKTSTISRTLVGNTIVDNSDVVGASPVGAAPTSTWVRDGPLGILSRESPPGAGAGKI